MASKLAPTNQYRCTREVPYHAGCAGYKDLSARQGHYIDADTEEEAFAEMRKRFPRESMFTVDFWQKTTKYVDA